METQPSRFRGTTNLNGRNPVSHTLLVTFAIHDAGIATAPKKGIAGVFVGCLAEVGYLFARGDVVSPDQGMEEGHRRECRGMERGGDSPVVALLESLASVNSALREAFACLKEAAEKVWRVKWDETGTCTRDATPSPRLDPTRPGSGHAPVGSEVKWMGMVRWV